MTSNRIKQMVLVAALCCGSAYGQVAYKGQLYVNNETFKQQGNLLHVRMKVSYDKSAISPGETLTFTPVLKNDSNLTRLSSVVITGYKAAKSSCKGKTQHISRGNVAVVVLKEKHTGKRFFVYNTTVPYKEWMQASALYVESEEGKGQHAHSFEDKVMDHIFSAQKTVAIRKSEVQEVSFSHDALLSWVQILKPEPLDNENMFVKKGEISLYGENGIGNESPNKQNKTVLDRITREIKDALQHYGTELTEVSVTGFSTPIGDYKKNESQCMDRALSLKRYLMQNKLTGKNSLNISWIAEDWDSIATLIGKSNMPLKEAALDIVKNVDLVNGRERVLKNLNGGVPYQYLKQNIFPQVCRIVYTLSFVKKDVDAPTGRLMLKNNPSNLSLNDFYTVATSYAPGSREYDEIMDLAARLFPENLEANIDAGAVALTKKDTKLAHKYLEKWQTNPKAYNNLGIMYLLEGNKDKAEVYLQMAKAAGVVQAAGALDYIKGMK